jgi:hypothetical protein
LVGRNYPLLVKSSGTIIEKGVITQQNSLAEDRGGEGNDQTLLKPTKRERRVPR